MEDAKQNRRTRCHHLPMIIGGMVVIACCDLAGAFAQTRDVTRPLQAVQKAHLDKSRSCFVELYAYLKVRGLAEEIGQDSDILDFALDDLRAGLIDCLDRGMPPDESEIFDHADPSGEPVPLVVTDVRASGVTRMPRGSERVA
jgi:hypothetical protein